MGRGGGGFQGGGKARQTNYPWGLQIVTTIKEWVVDLPGPEGPGAKTIALRAPNT